jgi:ABC-2 type transport system permease protein
MIDAGSVAWKEWREMLGQRGTRGKQGILLFAAAFGIVLPLLNGPAWITSPVIALAWSWVPMFLVTTVIADAFAGERERHTLETLLASRLSEGAILFGKIGAAIGYAGALTAASLILGIVTVNLAHPRGGILLYPLPVVEAMVVLGLLGAVFVAAVGTLISLRAATVRQAQQTLGAAIIVVLLVPLGVGKLLPAAWKHGLTGAGTVQLAMLGVAAFVVLDAAVLALAMRRFRRARLIAE